MNIIYISPKYYKHIAYPSDSLFMYSYSACLQVSELAT